MALRRSFIWKVATCLLPLYLLLPQIIIGYSHRQLLQGRWKDIQTCILDEDGCKPNPQLTQYFIDYARLPFLGIAQCVAYGVDNATCATNSECTFVEDAGKLLRSEFSDYGLCIKISTTDQAVALNDVRKAYVLMLWDQCLYDGTEWYQAAQCALQGDDCTGDCVHVPDEFPPHCRVNTSGDDPLDELQEFIQQGSINIQDAGLFGPCFVNLRFYSDLLFCSYVQLQAASNTSEVEEGAYEKCVANRLYDPYEYVENSRYFYFQSQECILKTESECNTTTVRLSNSLYRRITGNEDDYDYDYYYYDDGNEATILNTMFFPGFLGLLSLWILAFY